MVVWFRKYVVLDRVWHLRAVLLSENAEVMKVRKMPFMLTVIITVTTTTALIMTMAKTTKQKFKQGTK